MNKQLLIKNINIRQHQNNPKNPIIYFFTYLYRWCFYFLYYIRNVISPPKKSIIIDPVVKYIGTNKNKLLESFKHKDMNNNIENEFYNKKELQKLLLDKNNQLEKTWRTRVLIENTPRGNIIMHYDAYKQGFAYYSDINGIPYNILNAVAMKYVTIYHCRDLFIDNENLEEEKESPLIKLYLEQEKEEIKTIEKKDIPKIHDSAFAKFKNYRKIENNNEFDINKKNSEESKIDKEFSRNLFVNMGRVCNFNFLQKPVKKSNLNGFYSNLLDGVSSEGEIQHQVMNYSKYKELLMKKEKL